MKTSDDPFVQQHMEEFKEQLAAMAQHQNQALTMILAERLHQDLTPPNQPLTWRQRLQGAYQHVRQQITSPHRLNFEPFEKPSEEAVVIIDAPYTVISPDATQVVEPTTGKED